MQIIFENGQFLVVDKPAGLVVNKSTTTGEQTLQDELVKYFGLPAGDLGIGGRVGIVHRLDRETSGLMLVAKTMAAFENLQNQFKMRQVKKEYLALVHGKVVNDSGLIEVALVRAGAFGKFAVAKMRDHGGRETLTEYQVLKRYRFNNQKFDDLVNSSRFTKSRINYLKSHARDYSCVRVLPKTGRTHQIRVVLKHIGHPIVSDSIYAPAKLLKFDRFWCPRLFLHASFIEFCDLKSKKLVSFKSHVPDDLKGAMDMIDN